ncbi:hypothetical protein ACS0Y7_25875 [Burkholderia gladioli]|uniref:hypothetical protein n=1 Tax=Burkholderia gladioli TaxID=28095 RepID=UPI003F791584
MAISIAVTNGLNRPLEVKNLSTDVAICVDINQYFPPEILALQTATYATSDAYFFGTGDEVFEIELSDAATGTTFGFKCEWPGSILAVRIGAFEWGYRLTPAPTGHSSEWVMNSSYFIDQDVTTPVTVHNINSHFKFVIIPVINREVMSFRIGIALES